MPLFAVVSKTRAKHGKKEMVLSVVTQNFVLFFGGLVGRKEQEKKGGVEPIDTSPTPP